MLLEFGKGDRKCAVLPDQIVGVSTVDKNTIIHLASEHQLLVNETFQTARDKFRNYLIEKEATNGKK